MFPVYVLKSDEDMAKLPPEGTYYVVTKDGVMEHKVQGLIRSLTPAKKIPYLLGLDPAAAMLTPPIPAEVAYTAFRFFREVYSAHRSESVVRLFYSVPLGQFTVVCPQQEVSHTGVDYKREPWQGENPHKFVFLGTIHSHCDFGAGHSGIDVGDENHDDGFHATFGHVHQDEFSVVTSIVANGVRIPQDPLACIPSLRPAQEGRQARFAFDEACVSGLDPGPQIASWMSMVSHKIYSTPLRTHRRRRRGHGGLADFLGTPDTSFDIMLPGPGGDTNEAT